MGVNVQVTCSHSKWHYARILTRNRANSRRVCHSTPFSWSVLQNPEEIPRFPGSSYLWILLLLSRTDLTSHPTMIRALWPILILLGVSKMLNFPQNFTQKLEVLWGRKCDHCGGAEARKNHSSQGAHLQSHIDQPRNVTVMPAVVMLS